MNGPYHYFFKVDQSKSFFDAYLSLCQNKDDALVSISDDFVRYINDFLKWLPTEFYSDNGNIKATGLDLEGWSLITATSKEKGIQILKGLIDLFSSAPENIELTGYYDPEKEDYDIYAMDRKDVLKTLTLLYTAVNELNESNYILHLGI